MDSSNHPTAVIPADTRVRLATPQQVFNLPLFECFCLIDLRSPEIYAQGHLYTAHNFPFNGTTIDVQAFTTFVTQVLEDFSPERVDPIVLYHQSDAFVNIASSFAHQFSALLEKLPSRPETEKFTFGAMGTEFLHRVKTYNKQVWILQGGYEQWARLFPFLCKNAGSISHESEPTPHLIGPGLFLGSRAVDLSSRELLAGLNVTHIIHSTVNTPLVFYPGIQYLACAVADVDSQEMNSCWRACMDFIKAATAGPGRVLVQILGRSRSASIVIVYLMQSLALPLEAAVQMVLTQCPSVDTRLIYAPQLSRLDPSNSVPLIKGE